jgi:hypothetical protein
MTWRDGMAVLLAAYAAAAESAPNAVLTSPDATLLVWSDKDWKALPTKKTVSSGDALLVLPAERATLDLADALRLTLVGNTPEMHGTSTLETIVRLGSLDPKTGVELTLERGRIILVKANHKTPLRVRLKVRDQKFDLTLREPETTVGVELLGRWPPGTRFNPKPADDAAPTQMMPLVVSKGELDLHLSNEQHLMTAPSFFLWDSIAGSLPRPRPADKIPSWLDHQPLSKEGQQAQAAAEKLRTRLKNKPLFDVLAAAVHDADPAIRSVAVYGLGASDSPDLLLGALANERYADVRVAAASALRHWIGRGPHQDLLLYRALLARKFTEAQAEIVVQLLHAYSPADLEKPETYETLIAYLRSKQLPIRQLAISQLHALVPSGRKIAYDAAGPPESWQKAHDEWKRLIPDGKTPPPEKNP